MGSRSRSKLPNRDPKNSPKSPINKRTKNHPKVPKDLDFLSVGKNRTENQNPNVHHLKDPLTPLHRLRRFKEIRDRNLRKVALVKKTVKRKMSVDVEQEDTNEKKQSKEEFKNTNISVKEKTEKIINGESKNEEKANKVADEVEVVEKRGAMNGEHGEVSNSQKKIVTERVEIERKEIEISFTNDINDIVNDAAQETVDENKDIETVSDEEKGVKRNEKIESEKELPTEPSVRVLRRSMRGKAAADIPQPTTSKRSVSVEVQRKILEEPRDKPPPAVSLSAETQFVITSPVGGRRSLRQQRISGYKKRKYDDFTNEEYSHEKKQALSYTKSLTTPSVLSPGWQFVKSPLTRFWSPQNTPAPGQTPYKTPYSMETNIEDSMAVNFDDKSLYGNLNDSELDVTNTGTAESLQTSSATSSSSWRCSIM